MTKKERIQDLSTFTGGKQAITLGGFCRYMGIGKATAREMLSDLEFIRSGNARLYAIRDVAARLTYLQEV